MAALALAIAAGACAQQPTRVVVVVATDLAVPGEVDAVRFAIDATAMGGDVQLRDVALDAGGDELLVLPIVHDGGALGPLTIEVLALHDGDVAVRRAARLAFVPGRSVVLRLDLLRACEQRSCEDDRTCEAGECVALDVASEALPSWSGRDGLPPIPMGGAPDAGAGGDDASAPAHDAAIPGTDAGACATGCECAQVCESSCECRDGCACDLTCPPGGDCEDVRCEGTGSACTLVARSASNVRAECSNGASCTIDASGASNVRDVLCRGGASCDVDCHGTSSCVLRCESGASCLLRCDDDDDGCSLDCRDGPRTSCAGGVEACNRACP